MEVRKIFGLVLCSDEKRKLILTVIFQVMMERLSWRNRSVIQYRLHWWRHPLYREWHGCVYLKFRTIDYRGVGTVDTVELTERVVVPCDVGGHFKWQIKVYSYEGTERPHDTKVYIINFRMDSRGHPNGYHKYVTRSNEYFADEDRYLEPDNEDEIEEDSEEDSSGGSSGRVSSGMEISEEETSEVESSEIETDPEEDLELDLPSDPPAD